MNINKRKRYFRKQKLFGLFVTLFGIATIFILEGDATAALMIVPMGLYAIFTKKMVIYDEYFWEVERRKELRRKGLLK